MKVSAELLRKLDLATAAAGVTTNRLDRLPPLISDRALANYTGTLVRSVVAEFQAGTVVSSTTFSMPRRGFGPRPVTVLSARDRTLYDALVNFLRPSLQEESRTRENWGAFQGFGLPGSPASARYVVTIDIASMYEYVDHALLKRELVIQSMEAPIADSLLDLLGEAFPFARGLPQMMSSSDLLADVYIAVLERELLRYGCNVVRYADDFRVPVNDWGAAHRVIEHAAEAARSIGLVLSSEKTKIQLATTLEAEEKSLQSLFDMYFNDALTDLTTFEDVMDWYGEVSTVEIEPNEVEAVHEAFLRVLSDWQRDPRQSDIPQQLVSKSLRSLVKADTRIDDDILTAVAFHFPLRLSSLVEYLDGREQEAQANRRSLSQLVEMDRQSPWAKIWLLKAAAMVNAGDDDEHAEVIRKWADAQIRDEHEIVRAEAAWLLAGWKRLGGEDVGTLFGSATRITRAGIAAALGRRQDPTTQKVSNSICGASPLYKDAFEWGSKFDAANT